MSKNRIQQVLRKEKFHKDDLVFLLSFYDKEEKRFIFDKAKEIKKEFVGNKIYLRGLIEYSNLCSKDCLYCGIRKHNRHIQRYTLSNEDVLQSADYAFKNNYASLVIQSGELTGKGFYSGITNLLKDIHQLTEHSLKITLSCGEQPYKVYEEWYNAGADRYLLRIEASNKDLYKRIHPNNNKHSYDNRIKALHDLKKIGYQVGTGVMIGLPGQTLEDLADDLIFMQEFNIDMVGMGPYVEHIDTPLFDEHKVLIHQEERYQLTLVMYALLRIIMKDINIASTTALDALHTGGRVEALNIACNVLMPNLTPIQYLENYHLYNNKPDSLHADKLVKHIENYQTIHGNSIAFGQHGDSEHFLKRNRTIN